MFRIAIPKCPVTLWEAYDTGYTERYMGTPSSHPDAYKLGSVLHYAANFPDEYDFIFSFLSFPASYI